MPDDPQKKKPLVLGLLAAPFDALQAFLEQESAGGILLMIALVLSLAAKNSPWGSFALDPRPVQWIDEGLMTLFFLLVSLEIKRELVVGELSTAPQIALPALAALGGMIVPAAIYLGLTGGGPSWRGWAIPSATDIAFSLGVMTLLGGRVARSLKVFLTALAIFDDLGAIVVIALFYSGELHWLALAVAAAGIAGLVAANRCRRQSLAWYVPCGLIVWAGLLHSGVHPTLAGVATGLAIPVAESGPSQLVRLERLLHPWVSYGIVPLFAFAHAGLDLGGLSAQILTAPVFLGILLALAIGKPAGVCAASWAFVRWGGGALPAGASWRAFVGTALLTGIGFTMSLFIGQLAFADPARSEEVRLGVLAGSLVSSLAGLAVLGLGGRR